MPVPRVSGVLSQTSRLLNLLFPDSLPAGYYSAVLACCPPPSNPCRRQVPLLLLLVLSFCSPSCFIFFSLSKLDRTSLFRRDGFFVFFFFQKKVFSVVFPLLMKILCNYCIFREQSQSRSIRRSSVPSTLLTPRFWTLPCNFNDSANHFLPFVRSFSYFLATSSCQTPLQSSSDFQHMYNLVVFSFPYELSVFSCLPLSLLRVQLLMVFLIFRGSCRFAPTPINNMFYSNKALPPYREFLAPGIPPFMSLFFPLPSPPSLSTTPYDCSFLGTVVWSYCL